MYTVAAKILYLQRYSTDFRNLGFSTKMLRVDIWVQSFRCAGILVLQWQLKTLRIDNIWNFATFNMYIVPAKIQYLQRYLTLFSTSLSQLEDVEVGHWGGRFHVRRCSTFKMAWRKLCIWTTFEILPLSTCTLWLQKSDITKGIQPIFEIVASARRCWGREVEGKGSSVQVFYFCDGKVTTSRIDNIWNFATFNMYTAPAKILYLQRYSTDFRNLCLSSKMLKVGIWVESFMSAGILLLQWQGENLAYRQHLKFCHFQPVHRASKNNISPKVFTQFSRSLPQLEDVKGGHVRGKFQVCRCFNF